MRPIRRLFLHALWLASTLAASPFAQCATPAGAPPARRPALHYKLARYEFDTLPASGSEAAPQHVRWSYPVFIDDNTHNTHATQAMNAWLRLQSLATLLGDDDPLLKEAAHLSDRAVIAKAAVDPEFVGNALERAELHPVGAFGRYRSFESISENSGMAHPALGVHHYLFDVASGREVEVEALFKPDAERSLADLYDDQAHTDAHPCQNRSFSWGFAQLAAANALAFEYPYQHGDDVECNEITLQGPAVTRLLKAPRGLQPVYELVEDRP